MNIPFSPPDITQNEIDAVIDTLKSGWITTGPKTKQFEKELSVFTTTQRTVCLNSATAALELTLRILGIGPGDEVIVPAYTYTASASVVYHVGATLVLVDVPEGSFHIGAEEIQKAITPKTKAIIPVDIGGVMCDYSSIFKALNNQTQLFHPSNDMQAIFGRPIVIADAAHSLGASIQNCPSGSVADFTCFSFHAVKNLTTAEGGAVTWRNFNELDNEVLYRQYMLLSLHGHTKDALSKTNSGAWEYDILSPAYKYNMTDINAAIGIVQLQRYSAMLKRRKKLIEIYDSAFQETAVSGMSHYSCSSSSSGHLYLTRLMNHSSESRNQLIQRMAEAGISTNVHYKPLPLLTAYRNLGFNIKNYPHAFAQFQNELTLPLYSTMTDEQQRYVIQTLLQILNSRV